MQKRSWLFLLTMLVVAGLLGWLATQRLPETDEEKPKKGERNTPVAVEVAPVEEGQIERLRDFSGNLQALSEIVVAPKVTGRIRHLHVDLSDSVTRAQVVAELDNDEYVQAVHQAEADLAEARSLLADQAGRLRRSGFGTDAALVEAGRRRLRPVLMTTLTTILALLPLALGFGEGRSPGAPGQSRGGRAQCLHPYYPAADSGCLLPVPHPNR